MWRGVYMLAELLLAAPSMLHDTEAFGSKGRWRKWISSTRLNVSRPSVKHDFASSLFKSNDPSSWKKQHMSTRQFSPIFHPDSFHTLFPPQFLFSSASALDQSLNLGVPGWFLLLLSWSHNSELWWNPEAAQRCSTRRTGFCLGHFQASLPQNETHSSCRSQKSSRFVNGKKGICRYNLYVYCICIIYILYLYYIYSVFILICVYTYSSLILQ